MDGNLTIGPPYDLVISLYNMTAIQAEEEITKQLKKVANPKLVDQGGVKVRLDVLNLFDESYVLNDGTGIGEGAVKYGSRRGFYAGISYSFGR